MSAPDIRGWCPSLHEPMAAADGLIVRVKPYARGLSALDLRRIADAAEAHGSGRMELTSRGALQARGLDEASVAAFARAMIVAGLASADPAAERRRNLQMAFACGSELLGLAAAVETWLERDASLAALPAKFGYGFSPGRGPGAGSWADIVTLGDDARTLLIGGEITVAASPTPLDAIRRLTRAFLVLGAGLSEPPRRMKALLKAVGVEAVLAEAGVGGAAPAPARRADPPGVGHVGDGFGLGVCFGELTLERLRVVAEVAERFGDGRVALSPGRSIWLRGVARAWRAALSARAMEAGFIVRPDDPRLRLHACVGRSGCARAQADVRADALRLADLAPAEGLHVSGCAKGCAHPETAAATLVSRGVEGRYDLILNGAPMQPAASMDLTLNDIAERLSMIETPADYIRDGAAIYQRSFAIIRAEADLARFTPPQAQVVVRMIHACGMVELAEDVRMSSDFEAAARAALKAGRPILCDSEMVAHGVTRARLPAENAVICTLRDPRTPSLAQALSNTRSAAALDLWGDRLAGAVVAIGNAPTALFRLLELINAGAPRPAAVIGLPVGFVGAAESKAALAARGDLPFLVVQGRKGGSAMAAAAVNALASEVE